MHEFRPADVIDQDTRLAESLIAGDFGALDSLIARYGRAVEAVAGGRSHQDGSERTVEVFARAWLDRERVTPGEDFAPWLAAMAAEVADPPAADVSTAWTVAMAIDAVDPSERGSLRAHHVDGAELPDGAERDELRLRRRLSHLGDDGAVIAALDGAAQWNDPADDLSAQVRLRLGHGTADRDADGRGAGDAEVGGGERDDHIARPGRVTRSLRPVLLGLAGAVTVLFVAIIALSAASGSPDPIVLTADLTPTGAIADVEGGEVTVTERDHGLRFDLDAPTLPRRAGDQYYEAVLVLQDGSQLAIGTFNEGFAVALSGGVALDRIDEFLVVAGELGSDDAQVVLKLDVPTR